MKLAWCVVALLLPFASAQLEGVGNPAALDRYIQNGLNEANSLLSHQNEILRVANGIIGSPSDAPGLLPEEGETCDGSCSASEEILEIHAVDEGEDDFEITEAEGLNEYQLIKVRQRGARRNHVQTGLGTRIKDVTAKEAVLDVLESATRRCSGLETRSGPVVNIAGRENVRFLVYLNKTSEESTFKCRYVLW